MTSSERESLIKALRQDIAAGLDQTSAQTLFFQLSASDAARVLDDLTLDEARRIFDAVPMPTAAHLLTEVSKQTQAYLLRKANRELVCQILDELAMDDAAELIAELRPEEMESILANLPAVDAREVRELLAYPQDTAGRMMTEKFACIRREMTAGQVLAYLKTAPADLETVNDLYVLSADGILTGVCSLRMIVSAGDEIRVGDIMTTTVISVSAMSPARTVANLFSEHDFMALPVVDKTNRMLGIVTVDDIIDFLTVEFEKNYLKMAGTDADELDRKSPAQIAKLRVPWILATMFIELGAGIVIHLFDHTLTKIILLASFMPIISAISGNTGLQSAAIIIRGLSTGHVDLSHWKHAVSRQVQTTLILASTCAIVLGIIGAVWDKSAPFGFVVMFGMFMSVNIAGIVGTIIPLISKRLGYDPALTAGPFETAFQDVVGISIFLGLATAMLPLLK